MGRYLEHGRIYSFYDGVTTRIYIASGDFLTRNTECRVEAVSYTHLDVYKRQGYDVYDFNKVYHAVYNFCVVAMSNFYLDVTKDRLYCTNGVGRKAAQTTMYKILVALDKICLLYTSLYDGKLL